MLECQQGRQGKEIVPPFLYSMFLVSCAGTKTRYAIGVCLFMWLDDLLVFDNKPDCINSFYGEFNVWFSLRPRIFLDFLASECNVIERTEGTKLDFVKIIKFELLSLLFRPQKKHKDIVFLTSNVVNMRMKDGRYENRLVDFFYQQNEKNTVVIEDPYNLEYRRPRRKKVFYNGWFLIKQGRYCRLKRILAKKEKDADYLALSEIVDRIKKLFEGKFTEKYWDEIMENVYYDFLSFKYASKYYLNLFKKIRPKVVFQEDACCGRQHMAMVCRKLGIVYAELQHGAVRLNDFSYNYGEAFFNNEKLKNILPSYFLTFGEYWSKNIRIPSQKKTVGFPFLQNFAKNTKSNVKDLILIVSDGDSPEQSKTLIDYVTDYAEQNGLKIILKLHPCEYPNLEKWYGDIVQNESLQIKLFEPVYDYIVNARFVIGSASTVMYESLAFDVVPFVFESKKFMSNPYGKELFNTFATKSDLLNLMNGQTVLKNIEPKQFFDENWENSYLKFINEIINR